MEIFFEQTTRYCRLTEEDKRLILEEGETISLSKGDFLIREGQIDTHLYLIREGVVRAWYEEEDYNVTLWFGVAGEPVFSSWGYVEGRPCRLNIAASSNCEVMAFQKESVYKMIATSVTLSLWINYLFEKLLLSTDESLIDLTRPLATERYLTFTKKMPDILQKVPLKEIAGYLGVTPQSLSRIRAEIFKVKNEK